jgi:hypothetical protein
MHFTGGRSVRSTIVALGVLPVSEDQLVHGQVVDANRLGELSATAFPLSDDARVFLAARLCAEAAQKHVAAPAGTVGQRHYGVDSVPSLFLAIRRDADGHRCGSFPVRGTFRAFRGFCAALSNADRYA